MTAARTIKTVTSAQVRHSALVMTAMVCKTAPFGKALFMVLRLASEEPEGGPWRAEPLTVVIADLTQLGWGRNQGGRGFVLAVDGRSSSGKTTLAARLKDAAAGRSPGSGAYQDDGQT